MAKPPVTPELPARGLVIGLVVLFIVLTVIVVALRIVSRPLCKIRYGVEDLLVLGAVVLFWAECGLQIAAANLTPMVKDYYDPFYKRFSRYIYVVSIFYVPCVVLVNLSILCLYRRIFTTRALRRACHALMLANALYFFPALFTIMFACVPVQKFWAADVQGHCIYFSTPWLVTGIAEVLIDVAIFALPFWSIWQLNLNFTKKLLLSGIFILAGFSIITLICRLALGYIPHDDFVQHTIWIFVHVGTAILCACLPTLRPLFALLPPYMHRHRRSPQSHDASDDSRPSTDKKGFFFSSHGGSHAQHSHGRHSQEKIELAAAGGTTGRASSGDEAAPKPGRDIYERYNVCSSDDTLTTLAPAPASPLSPAPALVRPAELVSSDRHAAWPLPKDLV